MEEQSHQKKKNPINPPNKGISDFGKYSGIGFQMVAIILITTWVGIELDKLTASDFPLFTLILSLLGVFAAIYTAIKDFIR